MYPFVRIAKELFKAARQPRIGLTDTHVSHHLCWPWDIDFWMELNNGRTLTLFDLGRVPMAIRTGLAGALRRNGWGLTVAGSSVRYRRRVRMFDRIEMRSRCVGWDARFLYIEQSMWRGGECANHMILRAAMTSPAGIVPTADVLAALGSHDPSPALPDFVAAWIAADSQRPWPPAR
ncbi:MAG: acyl-CoA thioesterase [Rhodobacteraceae bacterium]|nr:acyl-CoA thioesterase [Paracoccaceae bacterium]